MKGTKRIVVKERRRPADLGVMGLLVRSVRKGRSRTAIREEQRDDSKRPPKSRGRRPGLRTARERHGLDVKALKRFGKEKPGA